MSPFSMLRFRRLTRFGAGAAADYRRMVMRHLRYCRRDHRDQRSAGTKTDRIDSDGMPRRIVRSLPVALVP